MTNPTDLVAELQGFAAACGASEAGDGAFTVLSQTGVGSEETERNLRAVLREAATLLSTLAAENKSAVVVCDSYADENQRLFDRATALEAQLHEAQQGEHCGLLVIAELRAQLARAREALEPFAAIETDPFGDRDNDGEIIRVEVRLGEIRRARETLRSPAPADGRGDNQMLASASCPQEPDGWKLVPVEPTEEMDSAARAECNRMAGCIDPVMHIWDVMLAAAPPVGSGRNLADAKSKDLPSEAREDGVRARLIAALDDEGIETTDRQVDAIVSALTAPDHGDVASQGGDK